MTDLNRAAMAGDYEGSNDNEKQAPEPDQPAEPKS